MAFNDSSLLEWKLLPVSAVAEHQKIQWQRIWSMAKSHPKVAAVEAACVAFMAVGAWQVGNWAYLLGYKIGFLFG